jgi:hypothetical protein
VAVEISVFFASLVIYFKAREFVKYGVIAFLEANLVMLDFI